MSKQPYDGQLWRRLRVVVLERDGYRCRIAGPACTHKATEVDHIVPVSKGGRVYDLLNLRAACKRCNSSKADRPEPPPPPPPSRDW